MARIRSIKPEFWTSEQVVECSTNARLLFIGLWNFCDDYGRHTFAPKQIKALIYPADDFTTGAIEAWLGELIAHGLIRKYAANDKQYLEVTGWHHQKIDKRQPAKFPAPPASASGSFDDHSPNVRRTVSTEGNTEGSSEPEKEVSSLRSDRAVECVETADAIPTEADAAFRQLAQEARPTRDDILAAAAAGLSPDALRLEWLTFVDKRRSTGSTAGRSGEWQSRLRGLAVPAATPTPERPNYPDAKHELWAEGPEMLAELGVAKSKCRSVIGKWLRECGDDAGGVLDAITRARQSKPVDPIPWIFRALPNNAKAKTGGDYLAHMARECDEEMEHGHVLDKSPGADRFRGPILDGVVATLPRPDREISQRGGSDAGGQIRDQQR